MDGDVLRSLHDRVALARRTARTRSRARRSRTSSRCAGSARPSGRRGDEGVLQHLEGDRVERAAGLGHRSRGTSRRACGCSATRRPPPSRRAARAWSSRAGRSGRARRARPGRQVVARVDRRVDRASPGRRSRPRARRSARASRRSARGAANSAFGVTPTALQLELVDLDRRVVAAVGVLALVLGVERLDGRVERLGGVDRRSAASATGRRSASSISRCEPHLVLGDALGGEPLARLGLEPRELRLDRAGVGLVGRAAGYISDRSWRTSTSRQPSAEVMPGLAARSRSGSQLLASAAPCSGPAPPKTTSAKSRGS